VTSGRLPERTILPPAAPFITACLLRAFMPSAAACAAWARNAPASATARLSLLWWRAGGSFLAYINMLSHATFNLTSHLSLPVRCTLTRARDAARSPHSRMEGCGRKSRGDAAKTQDGDFAQAGVNERNGCGWRWHLALHGAILLASKTVYADIAFYHYLHSRSKIDKHLCL